MYLTRNIERVAAEHSYPMEAFPIIHMLLLCPNFNKTCLTGMNH